MSVNLYVTSNQVSAERRLRLDWTISEVKSKLEQVTGIPPSSQVLTLYGAVTGSPGTVLREEHGLLGDYNPSDYGRLQIEDTRPVDTQINMYDLSNVEKYEMSTEEYEKRDESVLAWKQRNKLGRFDPSLQSQQEKDVQSTIDAVKSRDIAIGKRCKIIDGTDRLGVVRYVGPIPEIRGKTASKVDALILEKRYWVGIELDEPLGKNDGSIEGHCYFKTTPNHGAFIKPTLVDIGDYGPANYDDEDDEL